MAGESKKAGRPKKVVENTNDVKITENANENTLKSDLEKAQNENKELLNQLDEMKMLMAQMQDKINSISADKPQQIIVQQDADRNLTRSVKVTCMIGNEYWLSTEPNGRGKTYKFNGYGDTKPIKYLDMINIIEVYGNQFEKGMAIMSSKKDYEDLQIEYAYDNILTKEKMDKVLSLSDDEDVDIVLNLEDEMQEKVLMMIADNVVNGYSYDYNKINKLQKNTKLKSMIECMEEDSVEEDEE